MGDIFQKLRNKGRLSEICLMGAASMLCLLMSLYRMHHTESRFFFFLNWNLFLAFVPWAITTTFVVVPSLKKSKALVLMLLVAWLLFFPNAPYILTDIFHLRRDLKMPIWFDLTMVLSFAWVGLLYGLMSLWDIETLLLAWLPKSWIYCISSLLLFIGSFGIYLGRYLRWNSWDILSNPLALFFDIGGRVTDPFSYPRTWGMTLFMGLFLNMIYWALWWIRRRPDQPV